MLNKANKKTIKKAESINSHFYKNSIMMGLTKSLQRVGTCITLYHDGLCAINSFNKNSQLHGHSIFFKNRCLISVQYIRNRIVDIAYRIDGYLLYLKYNQQSKLDGECYIANYIDRTIFKVFYDNGEIKYKKKLVNLNALLIENAFNDNSFTLSIVGKVHESALKYQVTLDNIRMVKNGNKIQVNYTETPWEPFSSGLGFIFVFRSPQHGGYDPERNLYGDDFELNIIEKGFYKNNGLNGYGYRIFKNSNTYEGYFVDNVFENQGLLKNTQKNTWVYGSFKNGEMVNMYEFNNSGNEGAKSEILLEKLREEESNYVTTFLDEVNFNFIDDELSNIVLMGDYEEVRNITFEDKKKLVLKKITEAFLDEEAKNSAGPSSSRIPTERMNGKEKRKVNMKNHKINYLISEDLSSDVHYNYNEEDQNQQIENYTTRGGILNRIKTKNSANSAKSGRIFNSKTREKMNNITRLTYNDGEEGTVIKLHKVNSVNSNMKTKKSKIFANSTAEAYFAQKSEKSNQKSNTLALSTSRRNKSPGRITRIFQDSFKQSRRKQQKPSSELESNSESESIHKLQSIRKGSMERKQVKESSQRVSKKMIFQEQQKKETINSYKFAYQMIDVKRQPEKSDNQIPSPMLRRSRPLKKSFN